MTSDHEFIRHQPVLLAEVLEGLAPRPGEIVVDCTVGAGGHTRALVERVLPGGRVIGLDQDATMLERARARLADWPVTLVHGSFDQLGQYLQEEGIAGVDGVLADLGICSEQLDDPERGLSFQLDGYLDMRMDATCGPTAAELLNRLGERDLADLIFEFGEERFSRRIARRIVAERERTPLVRTAQLAELVRRCVPRRPGGIDSATRTFQALRIAVNDELGALDRLLDQLPIWVKPGGRAALISFHSLEDRRVKQAFRRREIWDEITRKPRMATVDEVRANPRSRSAKLRVARRKAHGGGP